MSLYNISFYFLKVNFETGNTPLLLSGSHHGDFFNKIYTDIHIFS